MHKTINHLSKMTSLFILILFTMSSCSTSEKGMGLGGLIGGTTGAVMGGISYPGKKGQYRTRNVVIGATLGTATGMLAGKLISDNITKEKKESFEKGRASGKQVDGNMPELSTPEVESKWVEGKVVGNRYIEGHFEHIIITPTRWEVN